MFLQDIAQDGASVRSGVRKGGVSFAAEEGLEVKVGSRGKGEDERHTGRSKMAFEAYIGSDSSYARKVEWMPRLKPGS
jgi:hypothetical protein